MTSPASALTSADPPLEHISREPRFDGRAAWLWVLTFALILYLGLKGGGYDPVVRSEAGIVAWWVVLLGGLLGVLPGIRPGRRAAIAVGLLAAFTAWSALASAWTISTELTVEETSRLVAYLGVIVLSVTTCGTRTSAVRHVAGAVGSAIAVIAALALLSRLRPGLFPGAEATAALLPGTQRRLSWPLDYWNGLAAFAALGLPLLFAVATSARRIAARAAAAAAIPVLVLCIYFAFSRAGALAAIVGALAFLALAPERPAKLLVGLVLAAGCALLVGLAATRHALAQGLLDSSARHEGTALLLAVIVVCAVVGALSAAVATASRRGRIPRTVSLPLPREQRAGGLAAVLAVLVLAFVVLGGPRHVSHAWHTFKQPASATLRQNAIDRFGSLNGNGRYLYWKVALDGLHGHWLEGWGPGTYVDIWQENALTTDWIRNAHSLYVETLSDTGVVGLALLVAFLLSVLGAALAVRRPEPGAPQRGDARRRTAGAGVAAAVIAFLVSAGLDWVWQVPVEPVAVMLLAGAVLAPAAPGTPSRAPSGAGTGAEPEPDAEPAGARRGPARVPVGLRVGLAALALVAIVLTAVPLAATTAVRASERAAAQGHLTAALADARTAIRVESGAGTPHLQAALVLELEGRIPAALAEARAATAADTRNAEDWLVRSRLEAESGQAGAAVLSFRRARALDRTSLLTRL